MRVTSDLAMRRPRSLRSLTTETSKAFQCYEVNLTASENLTRARITCLARKLVATRGFFDDKALESRFLTEEMGQYRLRNDVPINMSGSYKEEGLRIRNKLLLFRFRNLNKRKPTEKLVDRSIEPRLNQIFVPLLSIIDDPTAIEDPRELARRYNREMIADRGTEMEAQILEIVRDILDSPYPVRLTVKDIASWFAD